MREGLILGVCYTPNLENGRRDRNESKCQRGARHSGDIIGIRNLLGGIPSVRPPPYLTHLIGVTFFCFVFRTTHAVTKFYIFPVNIEDQAGRACIFFKIHNFIAFHDLHLHNCQPTIHWQLAMNFAKSLDPWWLLVFISRRITYSPSKIDFRKWWKISHNFWIGSSAKQNHNQMLFNQCHKNI